MTHNEEVQQLKRRVLNGEILKAIIEDASDRNEWSNPKINVLAMRALLNRFKTAEDCARHLQDLEPGCVVLSYWQQAKGEI